MLHERINITASFVEHLEVHENLTLTYALWINNDKSNKTTRIRTTLTYALWINNDKSNKTTRISTTYLLKLLYTGCSTKEVITLLLSRST